LTADNVLCFCFVMMSKQLNVLSVLNNSSLFTRTEYWDTVTSKLI